MNMENIQKKNSVKLIHFTSFLAWTFFLKFLALLYNWKKTREIEFHEIFMPPLVNSARFLHWPPFCQLFVYISTFLFCLQMFWLWQLGLTLISILRKVSFSFGPSNQDPWNLQVLINNFFVYIFFFGQLFVYIHQIFLGNFRWFSTKL